MRKQEPGDAIETFSIDLKTKAAKYNYSEIMDLIGRDRIVYGIID